MANIGLYVAPGANAPGWGYEALDTIRVTNTGVISGHYWVRQIMGRVGRYTATNVQITFACYSYTGGNPSTLIGKSAIYTATAYMIDNAGGQDLGGNVLTPFRLISGQNYGVGALGRLAQWSHGQNASGDTMYFRSGVVTPPNVLSYTSSSAQGKMNVWLVADPNVAPDIPTALLPANAASVPTVTPTLEGDFRDGNEVLTGFILGQADKMLQYQIVVYQNDGVTSVWAPSAYDATSAQHTARRFTHVYAGPALTAGTTYKWKARVSDLSGTWSSYTALQSFTPNSGGSVVNVLPTGKQTTATPGPFTATWTHGGALSAITAKVRLYRGTTLITESAEIDIVDTVSGGTMSATWAQTGFGTLSFGVTDYGFDMVGKDSTGLYSPWNISARKLFSTNAYPNIATGITPTNSVASSTRPILRGTLTDPDDAAAAVTVSAEVKDSGNVTRTIAMAYNATTLLYDAQTTVTEVPAYGTFQWRMRGTDASGFVGGWSPYATFVYADGPVVTVTAPTAAQVLTTNTPTVTWTVTAQAKYRVRLYDNATLLLIYDSGLITSTALSFVVPAGYLRDNGSYIVTVEVENTSALLGTSASRFFSIDFPAITSLNAVVASEEIRPWDPAGFPSAVLISWQASAYSTTEFVGYDIYRNGVLIQTVTSPTQVAWTDEHPPAGTHVYDVRQRITQGTDVNESASVTDGATIVLQGVVLTDAIEGDTYRAVLYRDGNRGISPVTDREEILGWGSGADVIERPIVYASDVYYHRFDASFKLKADERGTARGQLTAVMALSQRRKPVWIRTPDGDALYCAVEMSWSHVYPSGYTVDVKAVEIADGNAR